MSQSIITFADLINVQRQGTLYTGTVDSGMDFNLDIFGSTTYNLDGVIDRGVSSSGINTYRLTADVDWAGLIVQIPSTARISKIRMLCSATWTLSANASWDATSTGGTYAGLVSCQVKLGVFAGFTPTYASTANSDANDTDFENPGIVTVANISAALFNAGQFVEKTWDFTTLLPGGLPYITGAELEAAFTTVILAAGLTGTPIISGLLSDSQVTAISGGNPASDNISLDVSISVQTSQWQMIIDWENAVVSDIQPNPAENETAVTITGSGFTGLTDFTIEDGNGTVYPFTPTSLSDTEIVFTLPDTGTYMGTVTIFSGSIELGTLTIYIATGSGIYRIVKNKRNDTQYDRETGLTTNVAIPEPFGETGFIGG